MQKTDIDRSWVLDFMELLLPKASKDIKVEDAFTLRNKNLPDSLFKYFSSKKQNIHAVINNQIWLACPTTFNDPYDCHCHIDQSDLVTFNKFYGHFCKGDLINEILSVANGVEVFNRILANCVKKTLKVACLTDRADSFLMWAHYAESHKGFCVEYETSNLLENEYIKNSLLPVYYSDKVTDFTNYNFEFNDDKKSSSYFWRMALTKPLEFQYENEWRLITQNKGAGLFNGMAKPKAIYLGSKMDDFSKQCLITYANENNIEIHSTQIKSSNYKLEMVRLNPLEPKN